ncbi:MAG: amidohydrolase family protein, partial [Rhizobiales bacterium]|nr:amidohydrolase family protein [Hyphomicrobiales bacterium]
MSSEKLLRGRVLSFLDEPDGVDDASVYTYSEDGAILIRDRLIVASGEHAEVALRAAADAEVVDHRPNLLMPGFIDTHIHFPQVQVIASWADQLLDWLNTYTFPEETKFADPGHSARIASVFFDELLRHGTTTAAAYCSVHKASAEAFFGEAEKRNLRMIGGKVMMDRNAPDGVCDTPQSGYDDSKALIAEWHG